MLIGLEQVRTRLAPGADAWAGGASHYQRTGPGEAAFRFARATLGVVLTPMRGHWAAYGSDRRRPVPLLPGDGWILPAGLDAWCRWDGADVLNVAIDSDLLAEAGLADPGAFRPIAGATDPLLAQLAIGLHAAGPGGGRLYRDSLTAALASRLALVLGPGPADRLAPDPRIARAIDYLEAHLARDVGLGELAGVAAMSRFHFARSFRQSTGIAPHAYLVARRMERARQFLLATHETVAEIAWRVGYANPAKFSAQFRRHFGANPSALRAERTARTE